MKALVPAGTTGNSLRPLSHTMPEQLVPVANRPVLLHCLDNLREAGILDVCILVGPHDEAIQALVGDGSALALRVTYLVQHEPRGVAHGIGLAREFLGDDDFVVYLADNVVVGGIVELAERFEERRAEGVDDRRPAVQLCVTKVANPSAYGVVEVDHNGRVERVTEKPAQPRSDLAVMGVYFLTPAIHKAVRELRPNADGDYDLTDAVQWLVSRGHKVYAEMFSGYWKDTGRLDDVLECHRVLLEAVEPCTAGDVDSRSQLVGAVSVEAGARVVRSKVVGPVIIGAGSTVVDSYVGPYTSVGAGCVLAGAGIEYSIVLDRVAVRNVRGIHGSLIGRRAEVSGSAGEIARYQLVIGDDARVEVLA